MWNLPELILSGQLPLSESDNYCVRMDSFIEVKVSPGYFRFAILAVAGRKGKPETDVNIHYALDSNNGNIKAGQVENIFVLLDEDKGEEAVLVFEKALQLLEGLESPAPLNFNES